MYEGKPYYEHTSSESNLYIYRFDAADAYFVGPDLAETIVFAFGVSLTEDAALTEYLWYSEIDGDYVLDPLAHLECAGFFEK